MPKVSVVLPVYNHADYISGSIQSVLKQTFEDFELLVVDNCSTDNTVERIKQFDDPRLTLLINEENMGHLYSINRGISHSTGEYICVLCSDDGWDETKLEKQLTFYEENKEYGAVFTRVKMVDDWGKLFTDKKHPYYKVFEHLNCDRISTLRKFFIQGNFLCFPSVMIPSKIYREIGPFRSHFQQVGDYDYWVRIALKHPLHVLQEELTIFRIRQQEKNMSGKKPSTLIRIYPERVQVFKNFLKMERLQDLEALFPEASAEFGELEPSLIPFYISMLALKLGGHLAKSFAIETLFELFEKEDLVELIQKKHHFTYLNFIEISGKYDTYNYYGYRTKIKSTWFLFGRLLKNLSKGRIFC